jgi:hypothetical protein
MVFTDEYIAQGNTKYSIIASSYWIIMYDMVPPDRTHRFGERIAKVNVSAITYKMHSINTFECLNPKRSIFDVKKYPVSPINRNPSTRF